MSDEERLAELRAQVGIVYARLCADEALLKSLRREMCFLSAEIAVAKMPENVRNTLALASLPRNEYPRQPVVR